MTLLKHTVEFVTERSRLVEVAHELCSEPTIAMDVETDGLHHYPERVCLVQIASADKIFLIDAISAVDLSSLHKVLATQSIVKVFHGCDNDIRNLYKHWRLTISGLFDTRVAAQYMGVTQFGLDSLITQFVGKTIEKSKSVQRSNWGYRPLPERSLEYAADDVRYLFDLYFALKEKLEVSGRSFWVKEECIRLQDVRYKQVETDTLFLGVKASHHLDSRGLAVLKCLYDLREAEALRRTKPPFQVLADETLSALAVASDTDVFAALEFKNLSYTFKIELAKALDAGKRAEPIVRPPAKRIHLDPGYAERLHQLKQWRRTTGEGLSMDPAIIWPMSSLERIAKNPETLGDEIRAPEVRAWQREQFGASLEKHVTQSKATESQSAPL
ncbi:MAG: hypothetical protein EXR59_00805 [Dehalococcoidia bacterium]|nr:hypothetical protein [Dehalococcoidia bacterium]